MHKADRIRVDLKFAVDMYFDIYRNLYNISTEPDFKAVYDTVNRICKIPELSRYSDIGIALSSLLNLRDEKNIFTDIKSLLWSINSQRNSQKEKLEAFTVKLISKNYKKFGEACQAIKQRIDLMI